MTAIRTLIVDDHAMVLAGLSALLPQRSDGEFAVIATTTDADQAAALAAEHDAQLALVDLRMPEPGGVVAIARILEAAPNCKVVAVSGDAPREMIMEALLAGATGFLPKTLQPEDMIPPLRTIVGGGSVVPPALLADLAETWQRLTSGGDAPVLADGEDQLLRLLVAGHETAAMADALYVSPSTVKRYLSSLEERLGASSRVEAAFLAGWHRLVPPPERP